MDSQNGYSTFPNAMSLILLQDLYLDNISDLDRDKIAKLIHDKNIQSKEELERYLYHMDNDNFR
jgi:hypothetical protein